MREAPLRRGDRAPSICLLTVLLGLCACLLPAGARASQTVKLRANFSPNIPGAPTTIVFGFQVSPTSGTVPSPVTDVDLRLPAGMDLFTSTLGLAICDPVSLAERGPKTCSPNAHLGFGSALVEVPFGPEIVREAASIETVLGPLESGHLLLLFYAKAISPITAQLVFPAQLLADTGPFSGQIDTAIPPIPSVPEAPDASVTNFQSTIGPRGLTYYKDLHGHMAPFHPRGIAIPSVCPPKGYLFAANFRFQDGTAVTATATVPCPPRHRRRRASSH
jgi:hypothetical protein